MVTFDYCIPAFGWKWKATFSFPNCYCSCSERYQKKLIQQARCKISWHFGNTIRRTNAHYPEIHSQIHNFQPFRTSTKLISYSKLLILQNPIIDWTQQYSGPVYFSVKRVEVTIRRRKNKTSQVSYIDHRSYYNYTIYMTSIYNIIIPW